MGETVTGGCACGKVRFEAEIDNDDAYLCHCRMCQRATGSLSIAFKQVRTGGVRWLSEPDWFQSSPIAARPFCAHCGTSLGFRFADGAETMDLTVASFDDPGRYRPTHHFGAEAMHRAWLTTEGLPERKCSDYEALVERWKKATGSIPR